MVAGQKLRPFVILCHLIAAAIVVLAPTNTHAQQLPYGSIRILVGFAPGGTTDIAARLIAAEISEASGRTIVVENKPGASGRIVAEALKNATPDGTTLMLVPIVVPVIAPLVWKDLSYDPAKDFAPITHVAGYQYAFFVGLDHPARTMQELVAWMKAHPKQANFGTPGAGSLPHFLGMMIGKAAGIDMVHVGHRGQRLDRDVRAGEDAKAGYRSVVGSDRPRATNTRDPTEAHRTGLRTNRHDAGGTRRDHGSRHCPLGADHQGIGIQRGLGQTNAIARRCGGSIARRGNECPHMVG